MEPASEVGNADTGLAGLALSCDSSRASPSASTLISSSGGSMSESLYSCWSKSISGELFSRRSAVLGVH